MKKIMTVVFSALILVALSAPAWAQATPSTPAGQAKPASVSKAEKKQAKAKAKSKRKAKKAANANDAKK